ncbi:flavin reductase [Micromonospora sp. KC606]|uniref:flavin reductase n=1 Tax=Micromonospora sp. KC606 TaxID=2530379 RepID=UPI001049AFBA|nr:flavin reductase [Micromonospora sp. KC606]TDC85426.1 flavin reductase [Micromonospora sp. KC606]
MTAHTPLRPTWLCRVDAHPWPCGAAKLALLDHYREHPAELVAHLDALRETAHHDLTDLDGGREPNLTDRFVTWARTRS